MHLPLADGTLAEFLFSVTSPLIKSPFAVAGYARAKKCQAVSCFGPRTGRRLSLFCHERSGTTRGDRLRQESGGWARGDLRDRHSSSTSAVCSRIAARPPFRGRGCSLRIGGGSSRRFQFRLFRELRFITHHRGPLNG